MIAPGDDPQSVVTRLAHEHLDPVTARRWLRLARPAVQLLSPVGGASYDDLPRVGRLGGLPDVPPGFVWPVWEGHGPLPLVAEVDLGAVRAAGLDPGLALPRRGRLLAFHYDGPFLQDPDGVVDVDDPGTRAASRLLHLDDDPAARVPADGPAGLHVYPERVLRGRGTVSTPGWADVALVEELGDPAAGDGLAAHRRWMSHPVNAEAFRAALAAHLAPPDLSPDEVVHQLGGWAHHVQDPVEAEVAADPLRWRPVLQVGSEPRLGGPPAARSDDEMSWDDLGALYWLARDDRLAELDEVRFTRQSG